MALKPRPLRIGLCLSVSILSILRGRFGSTPQIPKENLGVYLQLPAQPCHLLPQLLPKAGWMISKKLSRWIAWKSSGGNYRPRIQPQAPFV